MSQEVLVIDDDRRITNMLRRTLAFAGYNVSTAGDGPGGLEVARQHRPDLIVLDVMLPGLDGLSVCRQLRAVTDTPILMLTARDDVPDRVLGLDAGADDYLVKPFAVEELLARARALLRRTRSPDEASPPVLSQAGVSLDLGSYALTRGDRTTRLGPIECKLLEIFLRYPGQVLSRDRLMEQVWGLEFEGESNVLEVYVYHLRAKLEADDLPRLIQTVRGVGYAFRE